MDAPISPQARLNEAIDLVNAGQIGRAMRVCRDTLNELPNDINMTALLGALLLKSKELGLAEKYLRRAIDLAPDFAKPHEDLGYLLQQSGRLEDAAASLSEAIRLDPKAEHAHLSLGRVLAQLGRGEQADASFDQAFELNPRRKLLAIAAEHHQAGRLEEAETAYRNLLAEVPNQVDALRLLAGILMERGRVEEAEAKLQQVISLAPDFCLAYVDLGNLLHEQYRYDEAIRCFERTTQLEPTRAKMHYLLASALASAGRTFDALAAYEKVLELRPSHAGAWLGLGHTLKTVGRQTEAVEAYRKCISMSPNNGESYWSLANLKTYHLNDQDIAAMENALAHAELSELSRVNFHFALAKAHEDSGAFEQAWHHYSQGNEEQRMLEHYDPVQSEVTNDELIEVFNANFLDSRQGQGHPETAPIFIVGLPRSGSTLVEQVLASHSQVEGTSELPYVGRVATSLNRNRADGINYPYSVRELKPQNWHQLAEDYLRQAQGHRFTNKPRFIDKMPNNFPSIGLIHLMLPDAKIIDTRRYPLDTTLSCYRQLFAKGQTFVYDLMEIGEYYLQYERMMDHWHEALPGRVLTVQYEEMVSDLENQVRRLLDYCELPWEDACLRFHETERPVRTASSEQVRQPIYAGSVNFWRHYDAHLDELKEVLAPSLPRYQQYETINR